MRWAWKRYYYCSIGYSAVHSASPSRVQGNLKSTNARPGVVLLLVLLARTSHHPVLSIICGISRHVKRRPVTRCLSYGIGTRCAVDSGWHFSTTTDAFFYRTIVRTCRSWEVARASVVHVSSSIFHLPARVTLSGQTLGFLPA